MAHRFLVQHMRVSLAIASVLNLAACGDGGRQSASGVGDKVVNCVEQSENPTWDPPVQAPFEDAFRLESAVVLPDSGDFIVTSVRSLDRDANGRLLIADSQSQDLKLFDSTGLPVARVGRAGKGPGEFEAPYAARFLPSGGIVAVDLRSRRVSFFDSEGTYDTSFAPKGQDPREIVVLDDSTFLIAGLTDFGRTNHMLARYSKDGTREASFLAADSVLFATEMRVDQPWVAVAPNGRIFAGLTVSPHIYRLDSAGTVDCASLAAPRGWKQLQPFEGQPSLSAMRSWIENATLVEGVAVASSGELLWEFAGQNAGEVIRHLVSFTPDLQPREMFGSVPGRLIYADDSMGVYFLAERPSGEYELRRYVYSGMELK